MEYVKDHDDWNRLKKALEWLPIAFPFEEKDIWWSSFGVNIGSEMDGKGKDYARPVIVLRKFGENSLFVIPLSVIKHVQPHIHVPIKHIKLHTDTCAVLNQVRTIGNKRLLEKIGVMDDTQFEIVVERVKKIIDYKNNKT